jgi:hypothetical protein
MLKNPTGMKGTLGSQNSTAVSCQVSLSLLLHVSTENYQRALVDESDVIRK